MKKSLVLILLVIAGCSSTPLENTYCPPDEAEAAYKELSDISRKWEDAVDIAEVTPRMSLGPAIADLQEIKRDLTAIEPPDCMIKGYSYLYESMNYRVRAFLAFMDNDEQSEIDEMFGMSSGAMQLAVNELVKVKKCLPNCTRE